jgi:hypothetical protein
LTSPGLHYYGNNIHTHQIFIENKILNILKTDNKSNIKSSNLIDKSFSGPAGGINHQPSTNTKNQNKNMNKNMNKNKNKNKEQELTGRVVQQQGELRGGELFAAQQCKVGVHLGAAQVAAAVHVEAVEHFGVRAHHAF